MLSQPAKSFPPQSSNTTTTTTTTTIQVVHPLKEASQFCYSLNCCFCSPIKICKVSHYCERLGLSLLLPPDTWLSIHDSTNAACPHKSFFLLAFSKFSQPVHITIGLGAQEQPFNAKPVLATVCSYCLDNQ